MTPAYMSQKLPPGWLEEPQAGKCAVWSERHIDGKRVQHGFLNVDCAQVSIDFDDTAGKEEAALLARYDECMDKLPYSKPLPYRLEGAGLGGFLFGLAVAYLVIRWLLHGRTIR